MRRTLLFLAALSLLVGCPTVKLSKMTVKDGSVSATGLTLAGEVIVEETEEVSLEEGTANEGRALIAMYLPVGWSIDGARMKSPQEGVVRKLIPVPQTAVMFGETFPEVPGEWWAFASNTQKVATGTWIHTLELDLKFPKKSKAAEMGVVVGVLADNLDEVPAPQLYDLSIKGKKAALTQKAFEGKLPEADPAKAGTDKASAG